MRRQGEMTFESNYPRPELIRPSVTLQLTGRAYEIVNGAGVMSILQPLVFFGWFYEWVWMIGIGILGFIGYLFFAIWSAKALEGVVEMPMGMRYGLAIGSVFASIPVYLVVSIWLTVSLWRQGARIGFGNWTGMDYKKRVRELEGRGE